MGIAGYAAKEHDISAKIKGGTNAWRRVEVVMGDIHISVK